MIWQKLSLEISSSLVETLSEMMLEAGAVSTTLEASTAEELFEPPPAATPLWQHTRICGLFETSADLSSLISSLQATIHPKAFIYKVETIEDQDWQSNCENTFQPLCFANKLWVCPSWNIVSDDSKALVLLDPGLAFGTGSHPATQLCLEWLAEQIKGDECVIDYGCGSGILSLAALKLGAKKVWAVDNDPQALEATLENARRNQINSNRLEAVLPEDLPAIKVQIVIANILANPLIKLAPHFADLLVVKGKIALSGILVEQLVAVEEAYKNWFCSLATSHQQEWGFLTGVRVLKGASHYPHENRNPR